MRMRRIMSAVLAISLLSAAPAAAVTSTSTSSLQSVSFVGGTGYVAGGYPVRNGFVSVTTDRGASWRVSAGWPSTYMVGVSAASATNAWAVSSSRNSAFWIDGGASWSQFDAVVPVGPTPQFWDVSHAGAGAAVLVGRRLDDPVNGDLATIWRTADGGATWTEAFAGPTYPPDSEGRVPQTNAKFEGVDISPAGDQMLAVGDEGPVDSAQGFQRVLAYRSTDQGASWTPETMPTTAASGTSSVAVQPVNDVVAIDGTYAVVVGPSRIVHRRTSAGWTATQLPLLGSSNYDFYGVDAYGTDPAAATVVAVGSGGVTAWSTNGGATWALRSTGTGSLLRSVAMLDADSAVAVGDNETILRTDNAGVTWTGQSAATPPNVAITAPGPTFALAGTDPIAFAGTANDGEGVGVSSVDIRFRRSPDAKYWTGSGWSATETWLPTQSSDGWAHWAYSFDPDAATRSGSYSVEVALKVRDAAGNERREVLASSGAIASALAITAPATCAYSGPATISGTLKTSTGAAVANVPVALEKVVGTVRTTLQTKSTDASGRVSFTVNPTSKTTYRLKFAGTPSVGLSVSATKSITPGTLVGKPSIPTGARRYVKFSTSGILKPRHAAGSYPVRVYFYRYEGGSWVKKGYVLAKAANYDTYSKYAASLSLAAGTYKLRAYTPADSGHISTWGSYTSAFTVK